MTDTPLMCAYVQKRLNLVRFFAARLGSMSAAEDLVQDLYLKIAGLDGAGEAVRNPAALLHTLANNLMLDRLRSERRTAARDDAWYVAGRHVIGGEDVADLPPADRAAEARLRLEALMIAIGELAPRTQEAFRLHKLNGLSHAETAREMGVSVSVVEKHISNALRALTARLG